MWLLFVFIFQQILDGILTWRWVYNEGNSFEINNLLLFYFNEIGVCNTLILAKIFAICLGIFLYKKECYKILFWLNTIYFFISTLPHFYIFLLLK